MSRKLPSKNGAQKPYNIGTNFAKRLAKRADARDRVAARKALGPGLPKKAEHHQLLIQQRHATNRTFSTIKAAA